MTTTSNYQTWPALPQALREVATNKDADNYRQVRSNYSRIGHPELVIMAENEQQVIETIKYAAQVRRVTQERVPFSFRSGGHGLTRASVNDGGIVLDISQLNKIEVIDPAKGIVSVQAGAKWGAVAKVLTPYNLVISSGNFGDTGVGGLATSGGIGYFVRLHGLTIDHIKGASLVTVDGTSKWVDEENEPELFWAIRGGSSQVGLVTEFLFEAKKLEAPNVADKLPIILQQANYQVENLATFVEKWGQWLRSAPREMTSFLMISEDWRAGYAVSAMNVWAGADQTRALPVLEEAMALDKVVQHHAALLPYPSIVPTPNGAHHGQQNLRIRNGLIDRADHRLGSAIAETLSHSGVAVIELRSLGGAVQDISAQQTAWPARHQEAFVSAWLQPMGAAAETEAFQPIKEFSTGVYGAYTSDLSSENAALTWPAATGEKLKRIAETVDPEGLFDQGLTIRNFTDKISTKISRP